MKSSPGWFLGLLLLLFCCSGASCRQWARPATPNSPVAFAGPPTLEDILYTINANTHRVNQLTAESATLATPFAPATLRASLVVDRPRRLRLRGKFIGQELDLGSNEDLFWFWARSDPERAIYYAYHQQFSEQLSNAILPVGPDWMVEAIGLVSLEPSGQHEGPSPRPDGSLEIRSRLERNGRPYSRVLVVDPKYGWIVENQILDASGQLLAVSRCANHVFYPDAGSSLPHRIHIELPPAQLSFRLDISRYAVNQLPGDPAELFAIPQIDGYRLVNLAVPEALSNQSAQLPAIPHTTYRLRYRGFENPAR